MDEVFGKVNVTQCHMTSELTWKLYNHSANMEEEQIRLEVTPKEYDYMQLTSAQNISHLTSAYSANSHHLPNTTSAIAGNALSQALTDSLLCLMKNLGKSSTVDAKTLSRRWRCPVEAAKRTLNRITQRAVRFWKNVSRDRLFRPMELALMYPYPNYKFFTDSVYGPCRSLD